MPTLGHTAGAHLSTQPWFTAIIIVHSMCLMNSVHQRCVWLDQRESHHHLSLVDIDHQINSKRIKPRSSKLGLSFAYVLARHCLAAVVVICYRMLFFQRQIIKRTVPPPPLPVQQWCAVVVAGRQCKCVQCLLCVSTQTRSERK